MELEMNWMDKINEIKNNGPSMADEKEQWEKHSIYKVPSQVTDLNKNAYKPQIISFGPYHNGEENLKLMEEHKYRALVRFLKRCEKPIELLYQRLDQVAQKLKDSYKPLDPIWTNDTPKFLEMMILDGCFILEILRDYDYDSEIPEKDELYDLDDPVFGMHGKINVIPYIKRDMLILENQIPMIVLHTLIQVENNSVEEENQHELLNKKIINLLNPNTPLIRSLGKCMHVLDVYRKSMIQEEPSHPTPQPNPTKKDWSCFEAQDGEYVIRSAIALQEVGISFKKSKTMSLKDFSFDRGVLRLPTLLLDNNIECIFLNLIAFERLHIGIGNEITSFIFLIGTIIDGAMDVSILSQNGILINILGNDQVVANLFNSMSKEICVDITKELEDMMDSMNHYYKKPWKRWRASLIRTYFRSPWAMVSLVVATFIFTFTIIQTIYTVLQFYQKEC